MLTVGLRASVAQLHSRHTELLRIQSRKAIDLKTKPTPSLPIRCAAVAVYRQVVDACEALGQEHPSLLNAINVRCWQQCQAAFQLLLCLIVAYFCIQLVWRLLHCLGALSQRPRSVAATQASVCVQFRRVFPSP